MKRMLTLFFFIIVLTSCSEDVKPATFETISLNESFDAEITATFSKAEGKDQRSTTINQNIENAIVETLSIADTKSDLNTLFKDFNNEFLEFKKNFDEASEPVWELDVETELVYQSEAVLTIVISTYEFKGGAHGNDQIKFLNLDAKTGTILTLDDFIENKNDLKSLAQIHFKKASELKDTTLNMDDFFFGKPFQLPENIGYSDDGLVLLYNPYDVVSYDQGYFEFVIPFEAVDSYLRIK
ncbi:DUF4163 domain-containing protein [Winogradskyella eckloniae]|uniref:DUF3298 and DUF4163 domain-containing protein n=1 Tax=Winogradskyella eckloniae TaxID=1089306 RepID=UPI0015674492|nr:DUF3298 and DUF4163 domain-containing protein [Winogradskyella eckloniae]NRD19027.1 DUF4163 domain-containing protein [Winogradskyella eckloniae]